MGFDVGKVTIEYLPHPAGIAKKFAYQLACEASCAGDGNAFASYLRNEMEKRAKRFANNNPLAEQLLIDWIASLPWDEDGYLMLNFNF